MHIVIVGASSIVLSLGKAFISAGHEVCVVDNDVNRCEEIEEILGSITVTGNPIDHLVLDKAGASRADILICATNRDDINLVTGRLARYHFGIVKIISLVRDPELYNIFSQAGFDAVIDVTELLSLSFQQAVSSSAIFNYMPVSGLVGRRLIEFKIPTRSSVVGKTIGELLLPEGSMVILIISRNGTVSIPSNQTEIVSGDELLAIVTPEGEDILDELLSKLDA